MICHLHPWTTGFPLLEKGRVSSRVAARNLYLTHLIPLFHQSSHDDSDAKLQQPEKKVISQLFSNVWKEQPIKEYSGGKINPQVPLVKDEQTER